ncbi:5630_t:CDS:1, partial [Dentiscutata heterogama]
FRTITELVYNKCYTKEILEIYPYLKVGEQLCHLHYCKLVELDRDRQEYKSKKTHDNNQAKKTMEPLPNNNDNVVSIFKL